ncbi:hypothetical protein [Amycolatopsis sp. DG1A-15b]|uniref:hypothetical protein n=1 Tax=Amycolatopsis sp. DG1A-15b TaxID=3052846 RepID=UPI00255B7752|nr:hypothetical protein [Amycolatopsis sp. DG1A-15b]WIX92482.1 hypothetical protein QRY02_19390 [Amycolatopsis sp. DG1A-15b]
MIAAFIDVPCHVRHGPPGGFDHNDRQRDLVGCVNDATTLAQSCNVLISRTERVRQI